jgi:hypothetical protein
LEERAKKAKQAAQPVSTRAAVFRRSHKYLRISLSVAASRWTRGLDSTWPRVPLAHFRCAPESNKPGTRDLGSPTGIRLRRLVAPIL